MRAVISAGGTGGHFYPAYALANKLMHQGWEVLFTVKKNDFCIDFLKEKNIPFIELDIKPFPRMANPFRYGDFMFKLGKSVKLSGNIIKDFTPNIVIAVGGYVSFPMALGAKLNKIPVLIHESNAVMGLANRFAACFADKVALGLPIRGLKSDKFILTGTPIREEFANKFTKEEAKKHLQLPADKKIIAVFGGSQGAKKLNEAVVEVVRNLCRCRYACRQAEQSHFNNNKSYPDFYFLHITGKRDYEYTKSLYGTAPENVKLIKYCNRMNVLMKAADLVISRAGAGTVAELLAVHTPAILVPFPYAPGNHQYYNAKILSDAGAAVVIKEIKNLPENLTATIKDILSEQVERDDKAICEILRLNQMQNAYNNLPLPSSLNASNKLLEITQILAK